MVMKANEAQCEPKWRMSPWYMMVETKRLVKSTEYITTGGYGVHKKRCTRKVLNNMGNWNIQRLKQ